MNSSVTLDEIEQLVNKTGKSYAGKGITIDKMLSKFMKEANRINRAKNKPESLIERLITVAKKDDLTARRRLIEILPQKMAVKKAMEILGKRYLDRKGGYTRIIKLGTRQGDGAEIVQIELI